MNLRQPFLAEAGYDAELVAYRVAADRVMLGMCVFLFVVCLMLAGLRSSWIAALVIGGGTLAMAVRLVRRHPGSLLTRVTMGCAFMVYTGLVIHQTGGSIEGHFAAFGLIGILLYYRDWRVIAAATVFIYLHHMVLGYAQWQGLAVYVFDTQDYWRKFAIHVAYFLPFVGLMGYLAVSLRREAYETRLVIRLARDVADGDFTRVAPANSRVSHGDGLLQSVERMRGCVLDLLRAMPTAVMIVRLGSDTVADVNEAWSRLFGLARQEVIGRPAASLPVWLADTPWALCLGQLLEPGRSMLELPMQRTGGAPFKLIITAVEHRTDALRLLVLTFEDVTVRRETERRMHQLAFHDMLTGLHNRAALTDHLQRLLQSLPGRRSTDGAGQAAAVLLLDLDDFKPVNDELGHDAGDKVLVRVARRIEEGLREQDFAARLGGDEFVVVLTNCADESQALQAAARIQALITAPIELGRGAVCRVGVTIGVALHSAEQPPLLPAALLERADRALYEAKRAGKGRVGVEPLNPTVGTPRSAACSDPPPWLRKAPCRPVRSA